MGVCKTAGVQPHVLQACLFPLVRMQFLGPRVSGQTFGLAFVPCIDGAPKVRPTPGCGKPKRQKLLSLFLYGLESRQIVRYLKGQAVCVFVQREQPAFFPIEARAP